MFTHILVPTDGSALSRKATRAAARFAKTMKAKVTSIYVTAPFHFVASDAYLSPELYSEAAHDAANSKAATKILAQAQKLCTESKVPWEGIHVSHDAPYVAIIAAAKRKRCDLILMASHGRRGISAVVLGSETNKVLTHSKIPVLVYR